MLAFAGTSLLVAQGARNTAYQRKISGAALLVSDSAVSRALIQLNNPNNGVLLARNYDPINPATGQNYLGADRIPNSGDETATAVDQWTGYNPSGSPCFQQQGLGAPDIALTGTIASNETYRILAYRYSSQTQTGTLLVQGTYQGQLSTVAVTLTIQPVLDNFPGVLGIGAGYGTLGTVALRGRQVLGRKGNIYYYPNSSADNSLTGYSPPGNASRPSYLNALYSSNAQDGANGDTVGGTIYACQVVPNLPFAGLGPNLGTITTSQTISGTGGTAPTYFQVNNIALANSDTLTVDTTGGPVVLEVTNKGNVGWQPERGITLTNNAKILNIRTDGQPPRVGDFRIMISGNSQVNLYNTTCIQNAFLYSNQDELRLLTSGPGCPSGQNTNFEGVVWAEEILSSKNNATNQPVSTYTGGAGQEFDTLVTPGATSGIEVPDDLTSLTDLLPYLNYPIRYKYRTIQNWQRIN